jgi:hypothetical protein
MVWYCESVTVVVAFMVGVEMVVEVVEAREQNYIPALTHTQLNSSARGTSPDEGSGGGEIRVGCRSSSTRSVNALEYQNVRTRMRVCRVIVNVW